MFNKMTEEYLLIRGGDSSYSMCELTVVGKSFLWHQVRCIVAVLILIGEGKESVQVRLAHTPSCSQCEIASLM